MNHLIGLTGLKQSGKSTSARYLRDTYGFHHADFSGPIRALVINVLDTTVEAMETIKEQPNPVLGGRTPRYAMQSLGTEWGRQMIHPDVWIMSMALRIRTTRAWSSPTFVSTTRPRSSPTTAATSSK